KLMQGGVWSVALMLVPGATCALALRAYTAQQRRHEHLAFLYRSMRGMQGAPDYESAVRELLSTARAMFRAELAEILIVPPVSSDRALRSVVSPQGDRLLEPTDLSDAE